jgi:hypothetical protein
MLSLAQLGYAAVATAALLTSAGPTARSRNTDRGSHQTHDLNRILALMAPLAKAVLESPDREALEANLDEQLFSGLFSDLIVKSIQALAQRRGEQVSVEFDEQFLPALEALGGDRSKAERALKLAQISTRLSSATVPSLYGDARNTHSIDSQLRVDLSDLLYDIQIPVEVREAVHADAESTICMITLAHAIADGANVSPWLVTELVERWLAGQVKGMPFLIAVAIEQGIDIHDCLPDDLRVRLDEFLEHEGMLDLNAAQQRADAISAQMGAITEHASRQILDVWPKS